VLLILSVAGCRSLRCTEERVFVVPFACTTTTQNHAFSVVGPSLWNGLSLALHFFPRSSLTLFMLSQRLLFSRAGIRSPPEWVSTERAT